jgi:HK97 family phage portal protein
VTEEQPVSAVAGGSTTAGLWMSADEALAMVPVYRAVALISQAIGAMPLRILDAAADGTRLEVMPRSLETLWRRPNSEEDRVSFVTRIVAHLLVWGDAFVFVGASRSGDAPELRLVEPTRVTVWRDAEGVRRYSVDGRSDVSWTDWRRGMVGPGVVHMRVGSLDGLRGRGPVVSVLEALGAGRAAELFAARYFASAGVPSGVISVKTRISQEAAQRLAEQFTALHSGPRQHRVAVLDQGAEWSPAGLKPGDLQLLEVRRFTVTEVARLFGIPPHLLADASQSTSWGSGIEEQNRQFVALTLRPYMALLEAALSDAFCWGTTMVVRLDPSALFVQSTRERYAGYFSARQAGILTVNEIRDMEDLPSVGEVGDNILTPLNMAPTPVAPTPAVAIPEA